MRYVRTSSLKRLFSFGRHSFDGDFPIACEENNTTSTAIVADTASPTTQPTHRPTWKCFSYQEIFRATNGFDSENMVGKGGYAEVYKGVLDDGQAIAVKMLTKATDDERKEKEFLTEIGTLGHVCHPNVTSLLGCCIENGLYLIFQFSSKGSVASILHDEISPTMDWETRNKIALGTAKGLYYLHKSCPRRIIHRDIKASNILLSEEYEPQISDFGLAKWLPSQWTHHSIVPIEGTFGHLAPEYFMHGVVDEKTDVFAFGVFCLELISGKKPVDNSHQSLHSWAKPLLSRGVIEEVVDPRLEGRFDSTQLHKLAFAASLCIRASSIWRPTMNEEGIRLQSLEMFINGEILEIILGGEVDKDKWKMPDEEEEEQEELWGFEDLECECDSSFSTSPHDTF